MKLNEFKLGQLITNNSDEHTHKYIKGDIYKVVGMYLEGYGNQSVLKIHNINGKYNKKYSNQYVESDKLHIFKEIKPRILYAYKERSGKIVFYENDQMDIIKKTLKRVKDKDINLPLILEE